MIQITSDLGHKLLITTYRIYLKAPSARPPSCSSSLRLARMSKWRKVSVAIRPEVINPYPVSLFSSSPPAY